MLTDETEALCASEQLELRRARRACELAEARSLRSYGRRRRRRSSSSPSWPVARSTCPASGRTRRRRRPGGGRGAKPSGGPDLSEASPGARLCPLRPPPLLVLPLLLLLPLLVSAAGAANHQQQQQTVPYKTCKLTWPRTSHSLRAQTNPPANQPNKQTNQQTSKPGR